MVFTHRARPRSADARTPTRAIADAAIELTARREVGLVSVLNPAFVLSQPALIATKLVWSPDGHYVVFAKRYEGLFQARADGASHLGRGVVGLLLVRRQVASGFSRSVL
jgi:hypothetical protein